MTRQHEDFIYQPEPASPVLPATSTQRANNELAHRAASASYKIRSTEPNADKWSALIAALPEDIRWLTRTYLEQHWRAMQRRDRDKRSETGNRELEKLREIVR